MFHLGTRRAVTTLLAIGIAGTLATRIWSQDFNTRVGQPPIASSPEAAKVYTAAADSQNKDEFEAAAKTWQRFIQEFSADPLAVHAHQYLGICQIQLNQFAAAADSFQKVLDAEQDLPFLEETYVNLGWSHYVPGAQGDLERLAAAERVFGMHLKKFSAGQLRDQSLFYRAEALYQIGRTDEAMAAYQHLVAEFPETHLRPTAIFALANGYHDQQQLEKAMATYDLFLEEFDDHVLIPDVELRKAQACLQLKQFEMAEKLFARAADCEGFYAVDQAIFQRGYCLSVQKKFAAAAEDYASVADEYPKSDLASQAKLEAGRCFYRAREYEHAVKWLRQALDENTLSSLEAAHWISRILLEQKRPQVALGAADAALEWARGSAINSEKLVPILRLDRAEALENLAGREAEAIVEYRKIVDLSDATTAPIALYQAARTALAIGDATLASEFADRFLREHQGHRLTVKVKALMAELALQTGNHATAERALRDLTEASQNAGDDAVVLTLKLGQSQFMQQKYEAAIETLQDIAVRLPTPADRARGWYFMGASFVEIGKLDSAIEALSTSLIEQPESVVAPHVCQRLAEALIHAHRPADARLTLRRMLTAFPSHPLCESALFRLSELDYAAREFKVAKQHYREFLKRYPESSWLDAAMLGLGKAEMQLKNLADARQWMDTLLQRDLDAEMETRCYNIRAVCRQRAGDYPGCLKDIEQVLSENPQPKQRSDALLVQATCLQELDRLEEARSSLESILEEHPTYERNDEVTYQLGWIAKLSERRPESIRRFAQVASQFPDSPFAAEANYHIGESAYEQEQYQNSVSFFQKAIKHSAAGSPVREKSLYKLGWSLFHLNAVDKAYQCFAQQVRESPDGELFADGQFMVGESLFKLRKISEALAAYDVISENRTLNRAAKPLMYLHAGQICNVQEDWEQATFWLQRLVRECADSPYLAKAYYELGVANEGHGEWQQAVRQFSQAAAYQSQIGARARFAMASLLVKHQQLDRAVREYQTLAYGYGGKTADMTTREFQALAGLAAAKTLKKMPAKDSADRIALRERAERIYQHVAESHAGTTWGDKAKSGLRQLNETAQATDTTQIR